jgi:translation initiation factor IF-3
LNAMTSGSSLFQEKTKKMKKFALLFSLVFVAGVAMAQDKPAEAPKADAPKAEAPKAPAAAAEKHADKAAMKSHDVNAEFVSFDAAKKMVTIKTETGEASAPVEGKAIAQVKTLKAGDKVVATCKDSAEGKHEAVTAIKLATAAPAAPEKK